MLGAAVRPAARAHIEVAAVAATVIVGAVAFPRRRRRNAKHASCVPSAQVGARARPVKPFVQALLNLVYGCVQLYAQLY